jgi:hypothetical protein
LSSKTLFAEEGVVGARKGGKYWGKTLKKGEKL